MVHALGGDAIGWAVEAGARSIEHGVFLTEKDAAAMARRGCFLVPTLVIYEQLAAMARAGAARPEPGREGDRGRGAPRRSRGASPGPRACKIALGSDFGHRDDHGHNLAELACLQRAGLGVEEVLLAATAVGAELCGVGDRLGRIAPGYEFDAIVLDEEPADLGVSANRARSPAYSSTACPSWRIPGCPVRGACVNLIKVIGIYGLTGGPQWAWPGSKDGGGDVVTDSRERKRAGQLPARRRPYSRRDLLRMGALGAGALGAAPMLAACSSGGSPRRRRAPAPRPPARPAPAAR